MNLILKNHKFNIKRINIKEGKKCNKILYDLDHVTMIGITLNVKNEMYIEDDDFIYIEVKDKELSNILKIIDNLINNKYDNYLSFLSFNKIKVKKHDTFDILRNITINNIKNINGKSKVQIFTL